MAALPLSAPPAPAPPIPAPPSGAKLTVDGKPVDPQLEAMLPQEKMSKTSPKVTLNGKALDEPEKAPAPAEPEPEPVVEDKYESPHARTMRLSIEAEMAAGRATLARRDQRQRDEMTLGQETAKAHAARLAAQVKADEPEKPAKPSKSAK